MDKSKYILDTIILAQQEACGELRLIEKVIVWH